MEEIKFCIIVRVYNAEKYITRCIESVINQSYKNWKLLLIDDGSTDSCFEICSSFQKKDERIVLIHQENGGGVAAQLTGFQNIDGDYICGLDADDWYDPTLLEIAKDKIEKNECDCLVFGYKIYDEDDNFLGNFIFDTKEIAYNQVDLVKKIMTSTAHALWLKIFKRDCIKYQDWEYLFLKEKGREFKFNNDVCLGIPLLFNCEKALFIPNCLYNYKVLLNSASHKKSPYLQFSVSLKTYEFLNELFQKHDLYDDDMKKIIATEILRETNSIIYYFIKPFRWRKEEVKKWFNMELMHKFVNEVEKYNLLEGTQLKMKIAFKIFIKKVVSSI